MANDFPVLHKIRHVASTLLSDVHEMGAALEDDEPQLSIRSLPSLLALQKCELTNREIRRLRVAVDVNACCPANCMVTALQGRWTTTGYLH